jgi:hypothetical protein
MTPNLDKKLQRLQDRMEAIAKDQTNPHWKSSYFDINTVIATLLPLLKGEKLVVNQPLTHIEGVPAIETVVTDSESGESFSRVVPLIQNPDPQKFGGVITYMRRYALVSMFLIQGEEDDDGNKASDVATKVPYAKKGPVYYKSGSQTPRIVPDGPNGEPF